MWEAYAWNTSVPVWWGGVLSQGGYRINQAQHWAMNYLGYILIRNLGIQWAEHYNWDKYSYGFPLYISQHFLHTQQTCGWISSLGGQSSQCLFLYAHVWLERVMVRFHFRRKKCPPFFLTDKNLKNENQSMQTSWAERLPLNFPEDEVYSQFLSGNTKLWNTTPKKPKLLIFCFKEVSMTKIIQSRSHCM